MTENAPNSLPWPPLVFGGLVIAGLSLHHVQPIALSANLTWPGYAVLGWMIGASALMLISIAGAILVAIAWLILVGRAAAIEEAAVNTMGAVSPLTESNEEIES